MRQGARKNLLVHCASLSTSAFALFTMLEVLVILVLVEEEVFQGYAQCKEK